MNTDSPKVPATAQLGLAYEERLGTILVEAQSFHNFSAVIDHELSQLVARWAHTAAPCSNRPSGRGAHLTP